MFIDFSLDLRRCRRQAGLTQRDVAHLLDINARKLWALEKGQCLPSLRELCGLSLIYGRTFESLYAAMFDEVRGTLGRQLATMPRNQRATSATLNRNATLNRLAERLAEETRSDDAA